MRIDVRELELGPVALKGEIPKSELGFDPAEIQVLSQIQIDLTAERQAIEVRIRGRLTTEVGLPCNRRGRWQALPESWFCYNLRPCAQSRGLTPTGGLTGWLQLMRR